jgi:hypothetical protein
LLPKYNFIFQQQEKMYPPQPRQTVQYSPGSSGHCFVIVTAEKYTPILRHGRCVFSGIFEAAGSTPNPFSIVMNLQACT